MRTRPAPALVGCTVAALLAVGCTARPVSASDAVSSPRKGAGESLVSSTARARSRANGLAVQVSASPSLATTADTVRLWVEAAMEHARGALSYDLSYGDGTTGGNVTPDVCVGGSGSPRRVTWRLRHRYRAAGTYHVAVTVGAVCSSYRVTARLTIHVRWAHVPKLAPVSESPVCATIPHLDALVVHRDVRLPENRFGFSFPARVVVDHPGQVRSVAQALCSLSPMPAGTLSCPADLGIEYVLYFSAPDRRFARVVVDASGCEGVSGVASTTLRATTALWDALGRALGLTLRPTGPTFGYPFGSRGRAAAFVPPTVP